MTLPTNKEEMIERGMTPLGLAGNEKHDAEVRSKLKGVHSAKASISQKIRFIKEGVTKEPNKVIMELISNPEASASQIQQLIQEASKRKLKDGDFIQLIRTCIAKHSALFGNKLSLDADVRVNTADTILNRLSEFKANGGVKTTEYKAPTQTAIEDLPLVAHKVLGEDNQIRTVEEPGYEVVEPEVVGE